MSIDLAKVKSDDNLKGASSLVEVAAMARVGALSAGAEVTGQRAAQMALDARRQERRGKSLRAAELIRASEGLKSLKREMGVQREKEQIRPLEPTDETALFQGRASKEGQGQAGLIVSLVAADGTVLDRTKSAAGGAFVLRNDADVSDARIVVADLDGSALGSVKVPDVKRKGHVFVDMPLEKLTVSPVKPSTDKVKMPDFVGKPFEDVAKAFGDEIPFGSVTLERVTEGASLVLGQTPAAGDAVERGTPVLLRVGSGDQALDFRTARALVRLDPMIIEAGLTDDILGTAEARLEAETLEDLFRLLELGPEKAAELLPKPDPTQAVVWLEAVKAVLAQFPGS